MSTIDSVTPLFKSTINNRACNRGDRKKLLNFKHNFSSSFIDPFDEFEWRTTDTEILDSHGRTVFKQCGVEVPAFWTDQATKIVASKYFRGHLDDDNREYSVRQVISRVVSTIYNWGKEQNYFLNDEAATAFKSELKYLLVNQYMAFNSPVWFNIGVDTVKYPQASACFINSVEDTMEGIMNLAAVEARLFKGGSGTGTNLSTIRSSREKLSKGGTASGPVSFMRGLDAFAGVIKSGGATRRAAKMVILDIDHPDILEFIDCKAIEEKKAHALIEAGYDGGFNIQGGAYDSVGFQNANHSVRVSDYFMQLSRETPDREFSTHYVTTGETCDIFNVNVVLRRIAEAAWTCGDPGIQFDDTINRWHTCKNSGRINASNPCSEYMFLDDTACNLASINLLKFLNPDGDFDFDAFDHACRITITAQEILVSNVYYPTQKIADNSENYRPLGLGYANLGALLMSMGIAYDSALGRTYAALITAQMTQSAYDQSVKMAKAMGPFNGYAKNAEPMNEVIRAHTNAVTNIESEIAKIDDTDSATIAKLRKQLDIIYKKFSKTCEKGEKVGYRNSQVTVIAPTGTIAFMMDCDTTGIEPEIALIKYKTLVGSGHLRIVNNRVRAALEKRKYDSTVIDDIIAYIDDYGTVEGCDDLLPEDLRIFDCAFKPENGSRYIHYLGHLKMMAAAQPFLSGAISKTVNVPEHITAEEIQAIYFTSWKLGLKSVAVYRDNSKRTQPLSTSKNQLNNNSTVYPSIITEELKPSRRRLPDERQSITHKFTVGQHEGYINVGLYDDGTPGEIFVNMSKEGSTMRGLMDAFATSISMLLQYNIPLTTLVRKFKDMRFEPHGWTGNSDIPQAKSLLDYIFRWLEIKFIGTSLSEQNTNDYKEERHKLYDIEENKKNSFENELQTYTEGSPTCHECGEFMVRAGTCYRCLNCGETSGCG